MLPLALYAVLCCTVVYVTPGAVCGVVLHSYLRYPWRCMRCCVVQLSMLPWRCMRCCVAQLSMLPLALYAVCGVVLHSYLCYPWRCMRCCVVQLSMLPLALYAVLCYTVIYVTPGAVCGVVLHSYLYYPGAVCGVVLHSYLCYPWRCMRCCVAQLSILPIHPILTVYYHCHYHYVLIVVVVNVHYYSPYDAYMIYRCIETDGVLSSNFSFVY